jgi:hypothetical protein
MIAICNAQACRLLSEDFVSAPPRQFASTSERWKSLAGGETNSCHGAHVLQGRHILGSPSLPAIVPAVPTPLRPLPGVSKDNQVVEYALSRTASPALIAEYQTQLPDKALLQAKLHEFYLQNQAAEGEV